MGNLGFGAPPHLLNATEHKQMSANNLMKVKKHIILIEKCVCIND